MRAGQVHFWKEKVKEGKPYFYSDRPDTNKLPRKSIRYDKPSFIYQRMDIAPENTSQSTALKSW